MDISSSVFQVVWVVEERSVFLKKVVFLLIVSPLGSNKFPDISSDEFTGVISNVKSSLIVGIVFKVKNCSSTVSTGRAKDCANSSLFDPELDILVSLESSIKMPSFEEIPLPDRVSISYIIGIIY